MWDYNPGKKLSTVKILEIKRKYRNTGQFQLSLSYTYQQSLGPSISLLRGVHPPEAIMLFPPLSDFPPIFEKFSDSVENLQNFTFSRKNVSNFNTPKFLMTFFYSSTTNFEFPPYIPCFSTFSPCFAKIIIFPYFLKFPPVLEQFTCFLHTFCVFRFPLL